MDGLITLADLPALGQGKTPTARITIGRLDSNLRDPRYGKFSITQTDVDSWKRNLDGIFGGSVSFDFDHSSDRGNGTKAACWISNIDQTGTKDGALITADAQFTRAGAKSVRDGDYKYTSPTFVENYTDEHGVKHGKALIGGALTNRPVLRQGMPTLSLSADTFEGVATPSEPKASKRERKRARQLARELSSPRDSRAQMDRKELAKLLDLPEDADQVTILAAVAKLDAGQESEPKTLDAAAQAKAERKAAKKAAKKAKQLARPNQDGTIALSADGYAELLTNANLGAAAARQLSEQTFDHAWEKALTEGRAAPSQEDDFRALHRENPDLCTKTLDGLVRIVPTTPKGSGEGPADEAPLGMDQDRYQLHIEAKALAARKMTADPNLDEADAYMLATQEIEDKKFTLENPGI